jgi:hypothetical protein
MSALDPASDTDVVEAGSQRRGLRDRGARSWSFLLAVTAIAAAGGLWLQQRASRPPAYARLLAAVSADGDVVLLDADTALVERTLVAGSGSPQPGLAWHARSGVVFFTRAEEGCQTIWRHDLDSHRTRLVVEGSLPSVSRDGRYLGYWKRSCPGGPANGQLAVLDIKKGVEVMAVPLVGEPGGTGPISYITAIDWGPDAILLVSAGDSGDAHPYVVELQRPPRSLPQASRLGLTAASGENLFDAAYVDARIVLASSCCDGPRYQARRIVERDPESGSLRVVASMSAYALSVDGRKRLRFLSFDLASGSSSLWALDRLDGVPTHIGDGFLDIDW